MKLSKRKLRQTIAVLAKVPEKKMTDKMMEAHLHFSTWQWRQSWGGWGSRPPPDFWHGGRGRSQRGSQGESLGSWTGRELLLYLIIQEVCSKVVTFEEKRNNLPRSSCKWPIFAWKFEYFFKSFEKSKFFGNLPGKIYTF